ncbi:MurR/RpiR family transcriptional regulator [Candidatus Stoquefichus sp. SB1]|jgi:DNA-binding MurR/RpiR family transcriptional regulator|uniref:MurR/RpiR family transcriptional regulator n=1 Tax=Candidatus Stoquefichus sp. SB1 TaxID=1658109 RepID=UPI00067EF6F7|nr:MurR/RpiR family transcriptional regulator [Candidatus Stoquefichus sp. SB1]
MLITHKIEQTHFSESEAIIVDFILKEGENIKHMSINAIAKETYTSAPLLVRIAKKLGYSGWSEFKEAYLKELDYLYNSCDIDASIPFVVSDDFTTIAHNISQLQIETIQDTMKLLDHDSLYHAIRLLRDAEEIDLYGVSDKVLLAQQFAQQMFFVHKNAHICLLPGDAKVQATMSNERHCAILISYSGETDFVLRVARILKERKTPFIAITCIADNDLSKMADVTLRISSREMLHTKIGDFATSQSVKCILDILYGCIFSLNYKKNLNDKIQIAKQIDDRVSGYEFIDEE